jgi:hypothetical protein
MPKKWRRKQCPVERQRVVKLPREAAIRLDGTVVDESAAMGRVFTVPADPKPSGIELDGGAWERLRDFARRFLGRR